MSFKRVLAVALPMLAMLGAIGGLAIAVHNRNNTISVLRQSLETQGVDPDRISVEPIQYDPVPVDHFRRLNYLIWMMVKIRCYLNFRPSRSNMPRMLI